MPIIILIILAFLFLKRKKDTFKEPVIMLGNINFTFLSAKKLEGTINLLVQNNNTDPIIITYIQLDIVKGKYRLGTIEKKQSVTIKGRSEKDIQLTFNIKPDISLIALLQKGDKEKLQGFIQGYYGNIPFKINISENITI